MDFTNVVARFSIFLEGLLNRKTINNLQELLLKAGINLYICDFLAILLLISIVLFILDLILIFFFNFSFYFLITVFVPFLALFLFINYKIEKRRDIIEKTSADFLRQLASMLRVGLSFENAMEYMSDYGSGPLYDEIRRAVIEIKLGNDFDKTWIKLTKRLNSKDLKHSFLIILDSRKSGGSIAQVLDDLSYDIREMCVLKSERESSVSMTIIFLVISAVIAAPFAMGMVNVYSDFVASLGKSNSLIMTVRNILGLYTIIHSFLVGLIISVIKYGHFRKFLQYSIPLTFVGYSVFYLISNFGVGFLSFTV